MNEVSWVYLAFLSLRRKLLLRLKNCRSVSEAIAICRKDIDSLSEEEKRWIDKNVAYLYDCPEVKVVTIWDSNYPQLLRQIYDSPIVLFCLGDVGLLQEKELIAVVGSRRATIYGQTIAEKIGYQLAIHSAVVVSGMAVGIDTSAHKGALKARGKTIAVLGSGFASIYPKSNMDLFDQIIKAGGLAISEFLPCMRATRFTFPRRNRIISGISKAVIVIEAAKRSGALITARYALEQGRDVFALPGPVNSPVSYGTNRLIADGAYPIFSLEDLIEMLGLEKTLDLNKSNFECKQGNSDCQMIIELIQRYNGVTLDILIDTVSRDFLWLMQKITELELRGVIQRKGNLICLK